MWTKQQREKYKQTHRKEIKEYAAKHHKKYYVNHKKEISIYDKKYRQEHKEEINARCRKQYLKHKKEMRKRAQKYRETHRELYRKSGKKDYQKHKEERIAQKKDYNLIPINKVKLHLRGRIWEVLKRNTKSATTMELTGCSTKELKQQLEKQFQVGMTWQNYGQWHIDHIKPCASFDLSKPGEQKKCFHYTNLQPLWARDNLSKGVKIL